MLSIIASLVSLEQPVCLTRELVVVHPQHLESGLDPCRHAVTHQLRQAYGEMMKIVRMMIKR